MTGKTEVWLTPTVRYNGDEETGVVLAAIDECYAHNEAIQELLSMVTDRRLTLKEGLEAAKGLATVSSNLYNAAVDLQFAIKEKMEKDGE